MRGNVMNIKYRHEKKKDIVTINGREVEFFSSTDAWIFLELMRGCYGFSPNRTAGCYPVTRLVPKTPSKNKVYLVGASERVN